MPSPGDHKQMCKFGTKRDIGYIRTSSLIKQFIDRAVKSKGRSATVEILSQPGYVEAEDNGEASESSVNRMLLPTRSGTSLDSFLKIEEELRQVR